LGVAGDRGIPGCTEGFCGLSAASPPGLYAALVTCCIVTAMDANARRAWAAYTVGVGLLPYNRSDPNGAPPNDSRSRFFRALEFLALSNGRKPSHAKAARTAGVPRGTVASWIHRDPDLQQQAEDVIRRAELEIADLEAEPLDEADRGALARIQEFPEEIDRIAKGQVPRREWMEIVFPPDEDGGSSEEWPRWTRVFPA
jgi:hypothetical protein